MNRTTPAIGSQYGETLWMLCEGCYRALELILGRTAARAEQERRAAALQRELPLFVEVRPQPAAVRRNEGPDVAAVLTVLEAVCGRLGINPSLLLSPRRTSLVNRARQLSMYLLREDLGLTFQAIAEVLGGKHHTTILHHCRDVAHELEYSPEVYADVQAIRAALQPAPDAGQAKEEGAASA